MGWPPSSGVKSVVRTPGTTLAQAVSSVYGRRSLAFLPRLARVAVANHSKPCLLLQAGQMYSPSPSGRPFAVTTDRKSTRLNSSHVEISYAVFCLKKKKKNEQHNFLQAPAKTRTSC